MPNYSTEAQARWDERWARRPEPGGPARFVIDAAAHFPPTGRVLDVAGGSGRNALWLASRGYDVTVADVSTVALDIFEGAAASRGLQVTAIHRDLEADGLPPGAWEVVLVNYYLDRAMLNAIPESLTRGGVLAFCQPTERDLERHPNRGSSYVLAGGEMANLADVMGLEVLVLEEGWGASGRHEARLVARKPGD